MSLIKKLQVEFQNMGLQFLYDNGEGLDVMMSNTDFNASECVVYAFLLSTTSFKDGKESANIGLFFSKLTEFDFNAIENDEIQEDCKEIAYRFLKRIEDGNTFSVGDVSLSRFYDTFSSNVTGVGIVTEFTELQGLTHCVEDYKFNKNGSFNKYCK